MNKTIKNLLLGLWIWIVPFLFRFFMWDPKMNIYTMPIQRVDAVIMVILGFSLSVALGFYFLTTKKVGQDNKKLDSDAIIKTAILWYVEICILDVIFLFSLLNISIDECVNMTLFYIIVPLITVTMGRVLKLYVSTNKHS